MGLEHLTAAPLDQHLGWRGEQAAPLSTVSGTATPLRTGVSFTTAIHTEQNLRDDKRFPLIQHQYEIYNRFIADSVLWLFSGLKVENIKHCLKAFYSRKHNCF